MAAIDRLFDAMLDNKSSDLHLAEGNPPHVRLHGKVQEVAGWGPLDREHIRSIVDMEGGWQGRGVRFLRRPNEARGVGGGVETPQSMRDVDPPCSIELKSISP